MGLSPLPSSSVQQAWQRIVEGFLAPFVEGATRTTEVCNHFNEGTKAQLGLILLLSQRNLSPQQSF